MVGIQEVHPEQELRPLAQPRSEFLETVERLTRIRIGDARPDLGALGLESQEVIEALCEAELRAGVGARRHRIGLVAVARQQLGQRVETGGEHGLRDHLMGCFREARNRAVAHAVAGWIQGGEERSQRRSRPRRDRVCVAKDHRALGEAFERASTLAVVSVEGQMVGAQGVDADQDEAGVGRGSAAREREREQKWRKPPHTSTSSSGTCSCSATKWSDISKAARVSSSTFANPSSESFRAAS